MASPDANNGHIDMPHELAGVFMRINITSYQNRILWCIWRKTIGWHKEKDKISLTQFQKATGLARWSVVRTLKELEDKKVIEVNRDSYINTYRFNSDYDKWKESSHSRVTSHFKANKVVTDKPLKVETGKLPTKEKKENIQKKSNHLHKEADEIFNYYCSKIKKLKVWSDKRKKMIKKRLKRWSSEELKKSIDGIANSDWHMKEGHNSIELIFRNDEQVEKYINQYEKNDKERREELPWIK